MKLRRILLLLVTLFILAPVSFGDTFGPASGHTINDVRVYPDGGLVLRFTPALSAGCQYNDHGVTPPTSPSYKTLVALAAMAFAMQKKVQLIYNGCAGSVSVTGLIVL